MVINNGANSTSNVQQVTIVTNNHYYINTPPAVVETVPKKDKVERFKKFMPVVYEAIKWLIKIGLLLIPLLYGA